MWMFCFFFKQKTAYEMRISDWSSDVCSSDLQRPKIAEAKNSRAVGDDRDKIAFRRVIISCCRIFCDGPHGYSDAGRIGKAEVPLGRHRLGTDDLSFSRPPMRVEQQRLTLGNYDRSEDPRRGKESGAREERREG